MKALIVAAGEGRRLAHLTQAVPKPLVRLLGLSLIERVVLTAKRAGIDQFVVVVGCLGDMIKESLKDGTRYGVEIVYVENGEWSKGNGISVLKARAFFDEAFILLMSDHVFDYRILRELIRNARRSSVVLAVDRREPLPGDTVALERKGRIVDIGKDIERSNCIDTGIFLCSPRIFHYVEESATEGKFELADAIARAAHNHDAEVFDITDIEGYDSKMRKAVTAWWIDVDTEQDLKRAQAKIVLNASKNPSDLVACYVHRPIENRLVPLVCRLGVTPNQVTLLVNILAYTATALFLTGHLLAASLFCLVVGIVDGLDGKLARVTLSTSRVGSLEHSFDLLFEFSWLIALALFLSFGGTSTVPLLLCACTIAFVAFYRSIYDRFGRVAGKSLDDYGDFERVFRRVAGRRNLYNIPILVGILLGAPLYSLVFIAFHAGVTAIVYASRAIKHLSTLDRRGA